MAAKKPKKLTYGELSNVQTELKMSMDNLKSRFPNDEVTSTKKLRDGTKVNLEQVTQRLAAMRNSGGVTPSTKTVNKLYRPSSRMPL